MNLFRSSSIAVAALLALCGPARALSAPACATAPYHQYDYFVGRWNVYNAHGKQFATDTVSRVLDGCAISEEWNGSSKGLGYSAFDAGTGRWFQAFFQDDGSVLRLSGVDTREGLLFSGDDYAKPGKKRMNRVLFRRLDANDVEEYWTVSEDGGATWKLAFDGFFRRR